MNEKAVIEHLEPYIKKAWDGPSGMVIDMHRCGGEGCDCLHIMIYPAVRELIGGRKDGRKVYARFVLDVNKLSRTFDKRPKILFDTAVGAAVPHVRLYGTIIDNKCDLSVYCYPPADLKPSERLYTQGDKKGTIEHINQPGVIHEEEPEE